MVTIPARAPLLAWLRNVAPDLRIGKAVENGRRVCFARFTLEGVVHEVAAEGDDPDEEIALVAANAARVALGLAAFGIPDRARELEQSIVLASIAGDDDHAAFLTKQLIAGRTARPLAATTNFRKRDQW